MSSPIKDHSEVPRADPSQELMLQRDGQDTWMNHLSMGSQTWDLWGCCPPNATLVLDNLSLVLSFFNPRSPYIQRRSSFLGITVETSAKNSDIVDCCGLMDSQKWMLGSKVSHEWTLHAQGTCWSLHETKCMTPVPLKEMSQLRAESPPWLVVAWDASISTKVCFIEGSVLWAARLKA